MSRSYRKPYYKDGGHKDKQAASRRYRRTCKQITKVYTKHFDYWDCVCGFDEDDICSIGGVWFEITYQQWHSIFMEDKDPSTNEMYRQMYLNPKKFKIWVDPFDFDIEYPHPYEITDPWTVRDYRIHIKPNMWKFDGDFHGYYDNNQEYKAACRK